VQIVVKELQQKYGAKRVVVSRCCQTLLVIQSVYTAAIAASSCSVLGAGGLYSCKCAADCTYVLHGLRVQLINFICLMISMLSAALVRVLNSMASCAACCITCVLQSPLHG
jgi:hypothetical protein